MAIIMEFTFIIPYSNGVKWLLDDVNVVCKLFMTTASVIPQLSSWLLLAATFDRIIAVYYPHKVKVWITRKKTIIAITVLILASRKYP